jgi:putative ABC transport system permease protein
MIRVSTSMQLSDDHERVLVLGVPPAFVSLFPGELGKAATEIRGLEGRTAWLGPALKFDPTDANASQSAVLETPTGQRKVGPVMPIGRVPFADLNGGAFVVMGIRAANKLFMKHGQLDALYVVRAKGTEPSTLHMRLRKAIHSRGVLRPPGSEAKAFQQTFSSLSLLTQLGAIGALWVAIFAVFNAMSMSLLERRRTVALLSVLGASRTQLAAAFLTEAAGFGAIGAIFGMGVGYVVAELSLGHALAAYPFLPLGSTAGVRVLPAVVAVSFFASFIVSILGAIMPIRRTLRAPPVESLSLDSSYEWVRYRARFHAGGSRLLAGLLLGLVVACCVVLPLPSESRIWIVPLLLVLLLSAAMLALPPVVAGLVRAAGWVLHRILGPVGALAAGSLGKNPGRTGITVGILGISLALVISLSTALGSFESTMTQVFVDRYGPPLYITSASYSGLTSSQPLPGRTARRIAQVPGVRAVYPLRYLPFSLSGRQVVVASAPMDREARDGFSNAIVATHGASREAIIAGLARGGVVLSDYTAALHHLDVGDELALPGAPRRLALKVVGIYDDVLSIEAMYMERRTYVRLSGDTSIDRIAIAPEAGVPPELLERRLDNFLTAHRIPAIVENRAVLIDEVLSNARGVFAIARTVQIAALIIAGLMVASTMLTTVRERSWEFAVCRALGMSRVMIRGEVLLEALVVGLIGSVIALGIGLGMGVLMLELMESRFLWVIGYAPPWTQLAVAVVVMIVAVLVVSLLPARFAGHASVVKSLGSP